MNKIIRCIWACIIVVAAWGVASADTITIPISNGTYGSFIEGTDTFESTDERLQLSAQIVNSSFSNSLDSNASGFGGYSVRQYIPASGISTSGAYVRVTFEADTVSGFGITAAYIGHRASTYVFDGGQVELTFSGNCFTSISAGATVTSDWVKFSLDETKDLLVAFDIGNGTAGVRKNSSATGYISYQSASPNRADAHRTTPSAMVPVSNRIDAVKQIDVYTFNSSSPSPTAYGYLALPSGTVLDMSTFSVYNESDGTPNAYTDTAIKVRVYANNAEITSGFSTLAAVRALSDPTITDTTNSVQVEIQYISTGSVLVQSQAYATVDATYATSATSGGNNVF